MSPFYCDTIAHYGIISAVFCETCL